VRTFWLPRRRVSLILLALPPCGACSSANNGGASPKATTDASHAVAAASCEPDRDGAAVGARGDAGSPGPSCNGLAPTCGPHSDENCCTSYVVPGGTFYRGYDGVTFKDKSYPATVSDFRLDRFEVTLGRFRQFVAAFSQSMIPDGSGKNPNDPNDPGWDGWTTMPGRAYGLPPDAASLITELGSPWTDTPGPNEDFPIVEVTWYEAYAFCIWDGGRLPTEAEWNYAAAGGCEQRLYPWSNPPVSGAFDHSYAVYSDGPKAPFSSRESVGMKSPKGDGKWGQADLAGNAAEWVLDLAGAYPLPCIDCTNLVPAGLGGSFPMVARVVQTYSDLFAITNRPPADYLRVALGGSYDPEMGLYAIGFRCARSP